MARIAPIMLDDERESLISILETLIDKRILATREKLGRLAVDIVDAGFWTNFDLEFHRLPHEPELLEKIAEFLTRYWLPGDTPYQLVPLSELDPRTYTIEVLEQLAQACNATWQTDGDTVLIGAVTPHVAEFVRSNLPQIKRVIALLGPSLHHVCTTWGLEQDQYRAMVSRDTLALLPEQVRFDMIY